MTDILGSTHARLCPVIRTMFGAQSFEDHETTEIINHAQMNKSRIAAVDGRKLVVQLHHSNSTSLASNLGIVLTSFNTLIIGLRFQRVSNSTFHEGEHPLSSACDFRFRHF